jgi:hypothetical protein
MKLLLKPLLRLFQSIWFVCGRVDAYEPTPEELVHPDKDVRRRQLLERIRENNR